MQLATITIWPKFISVLKVMPLAKITHEKPVPKLCVVQILALEGRMSYYCSCAIQRKVDVIGVLAM